LALVKLLLDPPKLLLMDEPTTHLDMSSIDALAFALDQFQGTLIFISHDVYFIRALANHVVHVNAGRLTHYPGGYQYYLDKTHAVSERAGLTAGASSRERTPARSVRPEPNLSNSRKDQKRLEAQERQAQSRERKARQVVVQKIEAEIQEAEARQAELIAELEKPETYEKGGSAAAINRELLEIQERLAKLAPDWEQAANRLQEMG
jgi:ATP-binding cassette subfamily F protein 3